MKSINADELLYLAHIKYVEPNEVLDILSSCINEIYNFGKIESEFDRKGNIVFYKEFYNKFKDLKRDKIQLKFNHELLKLFKRRLEAYSLNRRVKNFLISLNKNRVVKGRIIKKINDGFLISMNSFGIEAYFFEKDFVESEKKKLYRINHELTFKVKRYCLKDSPMITLSRITGFLDILRADIKEIFGNDYENVVSIEREFGKMISIKSLKKIPKQKIQKLSSKYRENVKVEFVKDYNGQSKRYKS